MLALNLGGVRFAWLSLPVLALFTVALAMGAFFVFRLVTAPEPLIPISILANPIVRCAIAANSFGWGAIIGLNIMLPIYLQSVMGLSAAEAGLSLVVFMVALNSSAGTFRAGPGPRAALQAAADGLSDAVHWGDRDHGAGARTV